jgi:putative ABC transport system ATP-binding protein
MFQRLSVEEGITIVLVTHDAGVANYAQRSIRICDGLIEDGIYTGEPSPVALQPGT